MGFQINVLSNAKSNSSMSQYVNLKHKLSSKKITLAKLEVSLETPKTENPNFDPLP